MSTISAAGVYPLIVSSGRDLDSSTTGETNEKKRELAYLIEKTRSLYTQLSMLSAGGVYNRSLKRSIHAIAIEIQASLPIQKKDDERLCNRLPLDTNPLAYQTERFTLRTLSSLIIEKLAQIDEKRLFTGYFHTSKVDQILTQCYLNLYSYAYSTQSF